MSATIEDTDRENVIPTAEVSKAGRLVSLDVFRGLTVAGMILANNPGSWGSVYAPLQHAKWDGWTPTDLIFPSFLFIVGVSITFALSKRLDAGRPSRGPVQGRPTDAHHLRRRPGAGGFSEVRQLADDPDSRRPGPDRPLLWRRVDDLPVHPGPWADPRGDRSAPGVLGDDDAHPRPRLRGRGSGEGTRPRLVPRPALASGTHLQAGLRSRGAPEYLAPRSPPRCSASSPVTGSDRAGRDTSSTPACSSRDRPPLSLDRPGVRPSRSTRPSGAARS